MRFIYFPLNKCPDRAEPVEREDLVEIEYSTVPVPSLLIRTGARLGAPSVAQLGARA